MLIGSQCAQAFQTAQVFCPVFPCLYIRQELLAQSVSTPRLRSLSRRPNMPASFSRGREVGADPSIAEVRSGCFEMIY